MHARPLLALLLSCGLAGGALATSAQAAPGAADDALVRLTVSHLALPALSREEAATKITEVGLRYLGLSSPERIASA